MEKWLPLEVVTAHDHKSTMKARRYYQTSTAYKEVLAEHDASYFAPYLNLVMSLTSEGSRVLDVGCGTGATISALTAAGRVAVGIDVSMMFLSSGDEGGYRAVGDASALPFLDRCFHVVASHDVLEHVGDVTTVLDEMRRVVATGGYLVIVCPNLLSPLRPLKYVYKILRGGKATPVWTESIWHGLAMVFQNMFRLLVRFLDPEPRLLYREPRDTDLAHITGGDVDATYIANPVDLGRIFRRVEGWKELKSDDWRRSEPRIRSAVRTVLPSLASPVVFVARRLD